MTIIFSYYKLVMKTQCKGELTPFHLSLAMAATPGDQECSTVRDETPQL